MAGTIVVETVIGDHDHEATHVLAVHMTDATTAIHQRSHHLHHRKILLNQVI